MLFAHSVCINVCLLSVSVSLSLSVKVVITVLGLRLFARTRHRLEGFQIVRLAINRVHADRRRILFEFFLTVALSDSIFVDFVNLVVLKLEKAKWRDDLASSKLTLFEATTACDIHKLYRGSI